MYIAEGAGNLLCFTITVNKGVDKEGLDKALEFEDLQERSDSLTFRAWKKTIKRWQGGS